MGIQTGEKESGGRDRRRMISVVRKAIELGRAVSSMAF